MHHSQGRLRSVTFRRCRDRVLHLATLAGALLAAGSVLAACGSPAAPATSSLPKAAAAYPVTVTSCGVPVTYDRAPTRAVSNDINTSEDMLALGLEPHGRHLRGHRRRPRR